VNQLCLICFFIRALYILAINAGVDVIPIFKSSEYLFIELSKYFLSSKVEKNLYVENVATKEGKTNANHEESNTLMNNMINIIIDNADIAFNPSVNNCLSFSQ